MDGLGNMQYSLILAVAGIGLLLIAFVLRIKSGKERRPAEDLLKRSPTPPARAVVAADTSALLPDRHADAIVSWEESKDVYKPTIVEAAAFVHTLGMARPPDPHAGRTYIFIRRNVYDKVLTHLKQDVRLEHGGLLFGQAFRDNHLNMFLIVVEDSVPAIGAQELPTSITYTSEAWRKITPAMQRMDPSWTLIGSYHSHPGMGVFLSSTDLDTQADVFAHPWQIALVVDPVADEVGFFAGDTGEPCQEWYLLSADRVTETPRT